MSGASREAILVAILKEASVYNECGEQLVDFVDQGRDCLDFTEVGRQRLHRMLAAAFEAGYAATGPVAR